MHSTSVKHHHVSLLNKLLIHCFPSNSENKWHFFVKSARIIMRLIINDNNECCLVNDWWLVAKQLCVMCFELFCTAMQLSYLCKMSLIVNNGTNYQYHFFFFNRWYPESNDCRWDIKLLKWNSNILHNIYSKFKLN